MLERHEEGVARAREPLRGLRSLWSAAMPALRADYRQGFYEGQAGIEEMRRPVASIASLGATRRASEDFASEAPTFGARRGSAASAGASALPWATRGPRATLPPRPAAQKQRTDDNREEYTQMEKVVEKPMNEEELERLIQGKGSEELYRLAGEIRERARHRREAERKEESERRRRLRREEKALAAEADESRQGRWLRAF